MDYKDLEKMFEVMISLEPINSKEVDIDKFDEDNAGMSPNFKTQNSGIPYKPRNPSLPMAVSAPSVRRGSMDTRKSLFYNERNQLNTKFNKLPLFRANSRDTKVQQEFESPELITEDLLRNHSLPKYYNDSNVYDTVSIVINDEDVESVTSDLERKCDNNRDTLTILSNNYRPLHNTEHIESLDILNKKSQRYSNLSDNSCQNRSVEDNQDNLGLQSAPESTRNSARIESRYSKDNQSSIDSGVDHPISVNLSSYLSNETNNSNDSFSDISESNIYTHSDKELFSQSSESPDKYSWMNTPSLSLIGSDLTIKNGEFSQPRAIPITSIRSEEEREKYLRLISLDMSIKSFSPKAIVTFVTRDGQSSSQVIDKFQTAVSVCHILKKKFNKAEEEFWQLVEVLEKESLERPLEDHENIFDIFYSWENENVNNRFIFQENPLMYKMFEQPSAFADEMKNDFEITDIIWVKGVNSKWIHATCFIADSTIYYTSKRTSKVPKDQYHFVNLKEVDFYTSSNPKKLKKEIKAQTTHIIIFKTNKLDHRYQENNYLVALNLQQRDKWLEALKVAKYSFNQLKNNYLENQITFPTGFRSQANSDATIEETHNSDEAFRLDNITN